MKLTLPEPILVAILVLGLTCFLCSGWYAAAWAILQPKGRVACADFGSYEDAKDAYDAGAKQLDGDGDGIPCEALYAHFHKN